MRRSLSLLLALFMASCVGSDIPVGDGAADVEEPPPRRDTTIPRPSDTDEDDPDGSPPGEDASDPLDSDSPEDLLDSSEDTAPSDVERDGDEFTEDTPDSTVEEPPPLISDVGTRCAESGDCEAGLCVQGIGPARVCTAPCVNPEDCYPYGRYECLRTGSVTFCAPYAETLCDPCTRDEQCGRLEDRCLTYPDGEYCGQQCSALLPCPDGFRCVDGPDGGQCVTVALSCSSCGDADLTTNPNHCGRCGNACALPNARSVCLQGACRIADGGCAPSFYNLDGDDETGCEYFCAHESLEVEDLPDDQLRDTNCDGIDGDRARAVFVRAGADPRGSGLQPSDPTGDLRFGIQQAVANGRSQVWLSVGVYTLRDPLVLREAIGIYGGYDAEFRSRTRARATVLVEAPTALRVEDLVGEATIDSVDWVASSAAGAGNSSIAIIVRDSGGFFSLRNATVTAGRGADGAPGGSGVIGGDGLAGFDGSAAFGGQGAGGGGRGGNGQVERAGLPGEVGASNGAPCGGQGGAGGFLGIGCSDGDPENGKDGGPGCLGTRGAEGPAGSAHGFLDDAGYAPADGSAGGQGGQGGGGGGAGAGGGERCAPLWFGTGRGGGGGGGGGMGGQGGFGGGGGGASIGIALYRSAAFLDNVLVRTQGGGQGGAGGPGGPGGEGGSGGVGATSSRSTEGDGGRGGPGGRGGTGGCGGGGGGGPSVGLWGGGGAAALVRNLRYELGPGGPGGERCSVFADARAGDEGLQAESFNLVVEE